MFAVVTHAGIAASVGRVCSRVCLFVRALKGKRIELSTPNVVHVYCIAVARHALIHGSMLRGYKNRHGRAVASTWIPYTYTLHCYL